MIRTKVSPPCPPTNNTHEKNTLSKDGRDMVLIRTREIEHLRAGTIEVRQTLASAADQLTDKEIHDSLWHYYYDIEKTVAYLLGVVEKKGKLAQAQKGKVGKTAGGLCISFV